MQLGSKPTRGTPRSTSGISSSRLRLAFSRASSTRPAESIGRPQQTTSGRYTRAPAAAKRRTAPIPISGHWYSVKVSLKSAISADPAPCGRSEKRLEKVFFLTFGKDRRESTPATAAARRARRVFVIAVLRGGARAAKGRPRREFPVAFLRG